MTLDVIFLLFCSRVFTLKFFSYLSGRQILDVGIRQRPEEHGDHSPPVRHCGLSLRTPRHDRR
jgi:hypothetical protein